MFSWLPIHHEPPEPSKTEPFKMAYVVAPGKLAPGRGLEISASGLTFLLDYPIAGKEANLEVLIRKHVVKMRVHVKKADRSAGHRRYYCMFEGLAADDWDRVVRYINDEPDIEHEGSYYDPAKIDDDYRTLPSTVQRQIIADLVTRLRLEEPPPGVAPLLRMKSLGDVRRKDGGVSKRIAIHSRMIVPGEEPKDFDTRYLIAPDGAVISQ